MRKKMKAGRKFWLAMIIFGLMGQIAWVVENMYFNVFIYKMFHASALEISLMVSASAIAATLTTWLMGALSDKVGKRKFFICAGYIVWGLSIFSFAFIRMDILTPLAGSVSAAATLGVSLTIIMDCVMTFFGSTANDACYNAWLTDRGGAANRGRIEGINSMMPLVAILVVFGGFMSFNLDDKNNWTTIFIIIGAATLVIGILGFFLIDDDFVKTKETDRYWHNVFYSFRPSVVKSNVLLYMIVGCFAIFGISIQIFMPYLILYYEQALHMENYVLVFAPAIVLAATATAFYGRVYDMMGFSKSVVPAIVILMLGYVILYFSTGTGAVFTGTLFMMMGYLMGMAMFGAMIRDNIPVDKTGLFQGLRIFGQVFIPGIVGPEIGALVLHNARTIVNNDGTTSFVPNRNIFLAAFIAAVVLLVVLFMIFHFIRISHYNLMEADRPGDEKDPVLRPMFSRENVQILDGEWECDGRKVIVPFPLEASASGYGKHNKVNEKFPKTPKHGRVICYRKDFVATLKESTRYILHFDAVDQSMYVLLNGKVVGANSGGYLPSEFDVSEYLRNDQRNVLSVFVRDPLSKAFPYGKQRKDRGGMWYTAVSGIWQSVWLEGVPYNRLSELKITPKADGNLDIICRTENGTEDPFNLKIYFPKENGVTDPKGAEMRREEVTLTSKDGCFLVDFNKVDDRARLWSPDEPYLYPLEITYGADTVKTYAALRTVDIRQVGDFKRICLNGKPIFLNGVLDQGYYPEGIFRPVAADGYEKDILRMKELGFNMLRKHIKIEPEEFYTACDRLGMFVLQDMVNNGSYSFVLDTILPTLGITHKNDHKKKIVNLFESRYTDLLNKRERFFLEMSKNTVNRLYNHPSVIGYTIFNEGWGQFESDRIYDVLKELDPTRFYDSTSGWWRQNRSDVDSRHVYYSAKELLVATDPDKALFLSEYGGFQLRIKGHGYSKYGSYGYGACHNFEELNEKLENIVNNFIVPSINTGLCGAVYTQLSDVEDEENGFYTYDRAVCKVDKKRINALMQKVRINSDNL